ncbi:MAG: hypothetical protein K0Q79_233 [Flavipsychrobacter sp.]|jgi:hypothetical protein|nr:hypothetical protein [Flavipsychrobacter sp.]
MGIRSLLLLCCMFLGVTSFAQNQKEKLTREEKDEKIKARQDRIDMKNDITIFKRQILGLKEYAAERKKIPDLQKTSKMMVKVTAVVDTEAIDQGADLKTLLGSIRQDVGDNSTVMYELVYDRAQKKISSIKRTPEAIDADRELADEKEEKATAKKPAAAKKPVAKKNKDEDDEEEDPDEEKPAKGKRNTDDDE